MSWSDILSNDGVQKSLIALLSGGVGVLATVVAHRIKTKDEQQTLLKKEEADRRAPHVNVRRSTTLGDQDGYLTQSTTWKVNPWWIDQDGPHGPAIRGWEFMRVVEETYPPGLRALSEYWLNEAKRRRDWLCFTEYKGDELVLTHTEPCAVEDAHLFVIAPDTSLRVLTKWTADLSKQ